MSNINEKYPTTINEETKCFKDLLAIYSQDLDYNSTVSMIQSFYSEKFSLTENQFFTIDQNEMRFEKEFNSSQDF